MHRRDDEPSVPNDFRTHSCDATGHVLLWACGPLGSFVLMDEAELLYPELLQNHSALFQFKIFHTKSHFPPRYFSLHTRTTQLCPTVVFSHCTACMWQANIFRNIDVTLSTVLFFLFWREVNCLSRSCVGLHVGTLHLGRHRLLNTRLFHYKLFRHVIIIIIFLLMPSLTQQCSETVVSTHSVVLSVFTKAAPACSQHPVSTSRITMTTEGDADHMRRMEDYRTSWRVVVTSSQWAQ